MGVEVGLLKREERADMKREAVVMVFLGVVASEAVRVWPAGGRLWRASVVSGVAAGAGVSFIKVPFALPSGDMPSALAAPALPLNQLARPPPPRGLSAVLLLPSPV